jgi:hypothetical protein
VGYQPFRSFWLVSRHNLIDHVVARRDRNEPVSAPAIAPEFPNPKSLITANCIRPAM